MDKSSNPDTRKHPLPTMGTMTMTQRPQAPGLGNDISLPPLMEILGDLYRTPYVESSRPIAHPRRFAEPRSPLSARRPASSGPTSSISAITSLGSPSTSKRRKLLHSPPNIPSTLPPARSIGDGQLDRDTSSAGPSGSYSTYTPTYHTPVQETERRRLSTISSTSHPETPSLLPVSALGNSRDPSSDIDKQPPPTLPSIFSPHGTHLPPPPPRHAYDGESSGGYHSHNHDYRYSSEHRSLDHHSSYRPASPIASHFNSNTPPRHPSLLTEAYTQRGSYMPRGSQPSGPSSGPFSSSPHLHHRMELGQDSFDQGPRLGPKRRRGNLPKHVTDMLRNWLNTHISHPYPTEEEKQQLCQVTGLTMNQISNWFINARRRRLPQRSDMDPHSLSQPQTVSPPRRSPPLPLPRGHHHQVHSMSHNILPPPSALSGQQPGHYDHTRR